MQKTLFMTDYCFFNNIYIRGEMLEEWKNSTVLPTYKIGDKNWNTMEELAYFMKVVKL